MIVSDKAGKNVIGRKSTPRGRLPDEKRAPGSVGGEASGRCKGRVNGNENQGWAGDRGGCGAFVVHQSGFDEFNDAGARGRCRPPSCGHRLIRPDRDSRFIGKGIDPDSFFYKFPLNTPEGLKTIASLLKRGWFVMEYQFGLRVSLFSVPSLSMMDRCPHSSCLLPCFTCRPTIHSSGSNEWRHRFLHHPPGEK
jgi:hypothetical protein